MPPRAVEDTAREVAGSASGKAATEAEAAIGPLREEAQVAGAVLHRLAIENDRLEREAAQAAAQVERLTGRAGRASAPTANANCTSSMTPRPRWSGWNAELAAGRTTGQGRPRAAAGADRGLARRRPGPRRRRGRGRAAGVGELAAQDAERRAAESPGEPTPVQTRLGRNARALDAAKADRAALGDRRRPPGRGGAEPSFDAALAALRGALVRKP